MKSPKPNVDAASGSLAVTQACASEFAALAQALLREPTADALHDYRISLRRLRVAVRNYCAASSPALKPGLLDELRLLSQQSGIARNWHVFVEETLDGLAREPSSLPITRLRRAAQKQGEQALQACVDAVSQPAFRHVIESLRELGTDEARAMIAGPEVSLERHALKLLRKQHRQVRKLWRQRTSLSDEALHELRKRFKKLRYTAEFFGPLFDEAATARYVKQLKLIQSHLGHLHDQSVARELASDPVLTNTDAPAAALVEGWALSSLRCDRERLATLRLGHSLRPWKH
jgi:triphosphatase